MKREILSCKTCPFHERHFIEPHEIEEYCLCYQRRDDRKGNPKPEWCHLKAVKIDN